MIKTRLALLGCLLLLGCGDPRGDDPGKPYEYVVRHEDGSYTTHMPKAYYRVNRQVIQDPGMIYQLQCDHPGHVLYSDYYVRPECLCTKDQESYQATVAITDKTLWCDCKTGFSLLMTLYCQIR